MKASPHRTNEPARLRAEAAVETHMRALFTRLPMLCGFAMADDLDVTNVTIQTWPGYIAGADLYGEIANAVVDLVEERPDVIELLQGRTFARAFH
ncbi:MAG: hypothetical protein E6H57_06515 [Betaproteobacteria bacterium]|nr:MAG: hypothetical protein E6H57_06515 [Betaproteobacteria bacterium]